MIPKPEVTSEESPAVFLSYRRADTAGHAGRLRDALRKRLRGGLFRDIDRIGGGQDFVQAIDEAVGRCKVLLVLIGDQWLSMSDAAGHRRLDNPADFVRMEIAEALGRGITVIPVLVEGAAMPSEASLPDDLKSLARRNAVELSETRWEYDVDQLVKVLGKYVEVCAEEAEGAREAKGFTAKRVVLALLAVAVLAGAVLVGRSLISESKKRKEIGQALNLAWDTKAAGDKLLSIQTSGYYPSTEEERRTMNAQATLLVKGFNEAGTNWTAKQPWLDGLRGTYPAVHAPLQGVQNNVEDYMNCVQAFTIAFKKREPVDKFNKCQDEKRRAEDSHAELSATVGIPRR